MQINNLFSSDGTEVTYLWSRCVFVLIKFEHPLLFVKMSMNPINIGLQKRLKASLFNDVTAVAANSAPCSCFITVRIIYICDTFVCLKNNSGENINRL